MFDFEFHRGQYSCYEESREETDAFRHALTAEDEHERKFFRQRNSSEISGIREFKIDQKELKALYSGQT